MELVQKDSVRFYICPTKTYNPFLFLGMMHQYKIILKKLKIMGLWIYASLDVRFQTLSSSYESSLPFTSPSYLGDYCLPACRNSVSCDCLSCSQKLWRKGDSPNQKTHILTVVRCEWSAGSTLASRRKIKRILDRLWKSCTKEEASLSYMNKWPTPFIINQANLLWRKIKL